MKSISDLLVACLPIELTGIRGCKARKGTQLLSCHQRRSRTANKPCSESHGESGGTREAAPDADDEHEENPLQPGEMDPWPLGPETFTWEHARWVMPRLLAAIEALPERKVSLPTAAAATTEERDLCVTCQEEFEEDETATELQCGHLFRKDHIAPWIPTSMCCPLERQPIFSGMLIVER